MKKNPNHFDEAVDEACKHFSFEWNGQQVPNKPKKDPLPLLFTLNGISLAPFKKLWKWIKK